MKREPDELMIDALRRAPGPVPSAELTAAVRARAVAAVRRRGLPTWINVAAALVLVVGAASWLRVAERVPEAMAPATMPPPASPSSTAPASAPGAPEAFSSEVLPAQMERAPEKTGEGPGSANTFGTPATPPVDPSQADGPASAASRAQAEVSVSPELLDSDSQRAEEAVAKKVEQSSDKLGDVRPEGHGAALDDEERAMAAQETVPSSAPLAADAPQEPFVPDPALALPAAKPAAPSAMQAPAQPSEPTPYSSTEASPPAPAAPPITQSAPAAVPAFSLAPAPSSAPEPPPQAVRELRDETRTTDALSDARFAQLRAALATGDAERAEALLDALKREVPREQWPSDLAERHWPR